ncbi:MAG TPA: AraC family transcriptional regulator N-terminal domain-containing protein [Steroidobacteraceae bacterium]|nr:AraC family transcriptional regulator N-terminal domain-containing protein [Steroidobacteraceae bacterium]
MTFVYDPLHYLAVSVTLPAHGDVVDASPDKPYLCLRIGPWAAAFFVVLTIGELYILPIGLALFGRLAPGNRTATSIAAWFLALSAGNLLGGAVGSLWSRLTPATFFTIVAAIACFAALMLKLLDRSARRLPSHYGPD